MCRGGESLLYDRLGTARAGTNSSQAVTFTQIPDAFGNTVTTTGSTASVYGFAATSGYRTDGDAGLMKVGCRYYDPQVGSFTTRDTYLDQKPYLYCEHDPVNHLDPSGHYDGWDAIGELVGFIAVALLDTSAPIWIPTGLLIVSIAISVKTVVGSIADGQEAIGDTHIGGGDNSGDRMGNGGRASRPVKGNINDMYDKFIDN